MFLYNEANVNKKKTGQQLILYVIGIPFKMFFYHKIKFKKYIFLP